MASRSHFAAPLLLAVITGLIVYVSLYPFRFVERRTDAARRRCATCRGPAPGAATCSTTCCCTCRSGSAWRCWSSRAGAAWPASRPACCSGRRCRWAWNCCRHRSYRASRACATCRSMLPGRLLGALLGSGFHALGSTDLAAGRATQPLGLRRNGHPDAVADRAPVAADSGPGPAPAQARRAAAAHAATRVDGARRLFRRLAGRRTGGVPPRRSGSVQWTCT